MQETTILRGQDQTNCLLGNSSTLEDQEFLQECWVLIKSRTPKTSLILHKDGSIRQICGENGIDGEADVYRVGLVDLNTDIQNLLELRQIGVLSDSDYSDICKKLLNIDCEPPRQREQPQYLYRSKAIKYMFRFLGVTGIPLLAYLGILSRQAFASPLPEAEFYNTADQEIFTLDQPPAAATLPPVVSGGESDEPLPIVPIEIETACGISPMYPDSIQQWCDLIDQYAAENGLDPNLVAAVMLQESSGQPDAYSKSGAVGLLQVMPRDGIAANFQCINGPCFADRPSMAELYDPETNVSYGSNMLDDLYDRFGNWRDALKAYGPKDVGYDYADIVLGILNSH